MDKITKEILVDLEWDELDIIFEMLEEGFREFKLPLKDIMKMLVCVEKLFCDLVKYSESYDRKCHVKLNIENNATQCLSTIELSYNGRNFNPMLKGEYSDCDEADESYLTENEEKMIKNVMHIVKHNYIHEKNTIYMEKIWRL